MVRLDKVSAARGRFRACLLETGGWIAFAFIAFAVQYFLCLQTGRAAVSVEIRTSLPGTFRIYWRHPAGFYQESDSVAISLMPGKHRYALVIPSLFTLADLRIDPLDGPGTIAIHGMSIRQHLYLPIQVDFGAFQEMYPAMQGIAAFKPDHDGGMTLTSTADDPWFVIEFDGSIDLRTLASWLAAAVLAGLVLNFLLHSKVLRGGRRGGILQVEIPEGHRDCSDKWLEDLAVMLPDVHLRRTTERTGWRVYQFAFVRAASTDLEAVIDTVQRHHPSLRLHLQLNGSGEVN